jgi:thioredoxin reductase
VSPVWECAVVGAGAAGLSAALVLGRARRHVVVIDAGHQSNRASPTIGGLLGYDQRPPADLYAQGRSELAAYPSVEFRTGEVVRGDSSDDGRLTHVVFADGDRLERDGLLVEAPLSQRSRLAEQLGAACTPGPLAGDAIGVDQIHRTNVPTVFAAGDVCTEQPHLAGAVAAGSQAAMIIVQSLLSDDFGLPYPPA